MGTGRGGMEIKRREEEEEERGVRGKESHARNRGERMMRKNRTWITRVLWNVRLEQRVEEAMTGAKVG